MKGKKLNAVMTIEMAVIIPFVLFMIMGLILTIFYFHDKNIVRGAVSETAVVGSTRTRESEEIEIEKLENFCRERLQGKCIFLVSHKIDVSVSDAEVMVEVTSAKREFSISAVSKAAVTEPERKIRNMRRLK